MVNSEESGNRKISEPKPSKKRVNWTKWGTVLTGITVLIALFGFLAYKGTNNVTGGSITFSGTNSGILQTGSNSTASQTFITPSPFVEASSSHWITTSINNEFETDFYFSIGNPGTSTPTVTFPCLKLKSINAPTWQRTLQGIDTTTGDVMNLKEWLVTFSTDEKSDTKQLCAHIELK